MPASPTFILDEEGMVYWTLGHHLHPAALRDIVWRHPQPGAEGQLGEESGARSKEPGVRSQESGARSQEPGVRCQESGARSQKPGVRNHDSGARSQEPGVGSQESGSAGKKVGERE